MRWVFKHCKLLGEGGSSFYVLSNGFKKAVLTWTEPGHMLESVYRLPRNIDENIGEIILIARITLTWAGTWLLHMQMNPCSILN